MDALEEIIIADLEEREKSDFALILKLQSEIDDLCAELVGKCQRCKLLREVEGRDARQ